MSELSFQGTTECIKKATGFGEDLYYNICTGQSTAVPWSAIDWTGNLFILSLLASVVAWALFVVAWALFVVFSIIHDRFF